MRIEAINREVSLPSIKTQTKCTKMTDESDTIKNGINGAVASVTTLHANRGGGSLSSGASGGITGTVSATIANTIRMQYSGTSIGSDSSHNNLNQETVGTGPGGIGAEVRSPSQGLGGRLQFFKDGKFILELARSREGEKAGWVSVPRKTYWPPSAPSTTTTSYPKNESSNSLSFSDDNSSIQSSPWQRDHCWKQASPRRGVSKELCMFFKRTKKLSLSNNGYKIAQIKRRRPYDISICKTPFNLVKNGFVKVELSDESRDDNDSAESDETLKKENTLTEEGDTPSITVDNSEVDKRKPPKCRAKLSTILQKLIDKLPTGLSYLSKVSPGGGLINHFSSTPSRISELHNHQQHVSPRKRILREFEKVSLEDNITKRSRAKCNSTLSPILPTSPSNTGGSQAVPIGSISQHITFPNNGCSQVANGNGTISDTNSTPVSNSTRLYSSYSIHSLLGNNHSNVQKNESNNTQNTKDIGDPSCLRKMLTSPNSSEQFYGVRNSYAGAGKRKSPTYSLPQDSHSHNRRSSRESPNKLLNNASVSSPASSGFHPYLSSPKYPSNSVSPNALSDNYKLKSGHSSGSPSHQQLKVSSNSRPSATAAYSPSIQNNKLTTINNSSINNSRLRETSPSEISQSSDRRDGTPRTVPKKTAALRQQFSSPSSSPNVSQGDTTYAYKSPSEQKRKNADERTVSPESKLYHQSLDLDHGTNSALLRSSSVMSPSAYYYMYPPHGSPGPHSAQPPYIPSVSYYHPIAPYAAAAVAALRSPLWMHYQSGMITTPGPPSRLSSTIFPYNGTSDLGPPPIHSSGIASMHLPSGPIHPWTPASVQNPRPEDSVALVNVKDEPNSDVPLNLSKH